MITFAAITPHSPLLLESINKDKLARVEQTRRAMDELADELYASHPDVIVLISEHPTSFSGAFSVNLSDPFTFDLSEFGHMDFDHSFRPSVQLVDKLQRSLRAQDQPITLTTDSALHYASAVPLSFLTKNLPKVQLLPITYSDLSPKMHYQFGQALKDVLMQSNKRIAVIASGDMSHALTSDAPQGFDKAGPMFDEKIQELITTKNTAGLLKLNEDVVRDAHQTIYRPLLILFGLMERVSTKTHVLSYEAPFGVGYLVANLQMT